MKKYLTTGWHFMRVFRLLAGVAGLTYAIVEHDYLLGAVGLFLLLTAVFNAGCCSSGGCAVPGQGRVK